MGPHRSGFVTLLGKPNVGKSTLLNRLVATKISITSNKPNTTRHRILGIRTGEQSQIVFVDTPGVHSRQKKAVNRIINKTARQSIEGVDVLALMISAKGWQNEDQYALNLVKDVKVPIVLVINKIDMVKPKERLLPLIAECRDIGEFAEIVPVSARTGHNQEVLVKALEQMLPPGPTCFPAGQVTDRGDQFMATELVREQVFRQLGDELPYATAVRLQAYDARDDVVHIQADIWVERQSHKGIVIGEQGQRLKKIGTLARQGIEGYLNRKVNLQLWVKVRKDWADNRIDLHNLGYDGYS